MEVAGDARALLGGREAALSLGLALCAQRSLLELCEPLASESRAVAGEPGRRPDDGPEQELGRELALIRCGPSRTTRLVTRAAVQMRGRLSSRFSATE